MLNPPISDSATSDEECPLKLHDILNGPWMQVIDRMEQ
jgi:hypothetical protein